MYRYLILLLVLLAAGTPCVEGKFTTINQSHGETWIKWSWGMDGDLGNEELLVLYMDDAIVHTYDLKYTPAALVPTYYSRADFNSNEEHTLKLVLLDNKTQPATLIDYKTSTVTTSLPATYFYIVLGIAVLLFIISIVAFSSRMEMIGLFLDVGAILLLAYLAVTTYQFNPALSVISIILGVMSAIPPFYMLYRLYEKSQNWSE